MQEHRISHFHHEDSRVIPLLVNQPTVSVTPSSTLRYLKFVGVLE